MSRMFIAPVVAAAVGMCAPLAFAQDAGLSRNERTLPTFGGGKPESVPCAPTVITHSLNKEVEAFNSVSCNLLGFHKDNYYIRSFTLADFNEGPTFNVCAVELGIELALNIFGHDQPIQVELFNTADVSNLNGGTLIASEWFDIENQFLKKETLPINATTSTGELSVVIFTPHDGLNSFFIGTNDDGQTGPSYIAAPHCDINAPTDLASLGFPDVHYVLNVRGSTVDGNDCNENGVPDDIDILKGTSEDCNENGIPDECEVAPTFDPNASVAQDHCFDAEDVCPGIFYWDDTFGATATNGPIQCGNFFCQYDVFYRYWPATSGQAFVGLEAGGAHFVYGVYDDCPSNGGEILECNRINPTGVVFHAQAETPYYIRIAKRNFGHGSFTMRVLGPDCILNPNDVNGNLIPDECECPEDIDGDGNVDMDDYIAVLNAVGEPCNYCPEDVDGDGDVDHYDVMRVILQIKSKNPCGAPQKPA